MMIFVHLLHHQQVVGLDHQRSPHQHSEVTHQPSLVANHLAHQCTATATATKVFPHLWFRAVPALSRSRSHLCASCMATATTSGDDDYLSLYKSGGFSS